jgi:hypothetical protein
MMVGGSSIPLIQHGKNRPRDAGAVVILDMIPSAEVIEPLHTKKRTLHLSCVEAFGRGASSESCLLPPSKARRG